MRKGLRIRIVVGAVWVFLTLVAYQGDSFNPLWSSGHLFVLGLGLLIIFGIDIWRWVQRGD